MNRELPSGSYVGVGSTYLFDPLNSNQSSFNTLPISSIYPGETCKTLHNTTGICTDLQRCKPFLESERQAGANPATSQLLELENCGFDGIVPKATPVTTNCTFLSSVESRGGRAFLAHKLPALLEPPVCGWSSIPLDRVVGGVPATLGALPWMALLGYMDESVTSGVSWKCGGALVSTRHVLTAAHCIGGSEHLL
ncbi:Hemolymph proteinase 17 short form [Operophtera brumata]|uniref:Hemolymph proteinase 17 short form n=1 Tax=Operophtera brumata TaxID=104452 RepID=A0A0L7L6M7_OPEBR|nr:Hemolymph proteinase 17 short form [Operophtera brumata]